MEDILIIDNNSIEESVIDETEYKDNQPVNSDISIDKSVNKIELIEEESIENESKQVNQSDGIIFGSNDINGIGSVKSVNLRDIENYDSFIFWENNSPNDQFHTINIPLINSFYDYDLIGIECKYSRYSNDKYEVYFNPIDSLNHTGNEFCGGVNCSISGSIANRFLYIYNNNFYIGNCFYLNYNAGAIDDYLIPIKIKLYKAKTLSNNDIPINPSVSGNNIYYNYNIYVNGVSENLLSYNVLNKPLNEYNVQESLLSMSVLFMLGFGFVILMRKAVFRWR